MPRFTTRVELHGADEREDYDALHAAMERQGFERTIKTQSGAVHLPTAEYNFVGDAGVDDVLERAKRAAQQTGYECAILVTEAVTRRWYGLEQV